RNDARRRRAAQTERVADRDDPVADARLRLLFERDEGETGAFDLDDGQIGVLVTANQPAFQLAAVPELDADLLGVLDDMVVGDDKTVARDEEARPGAGGQLGVVFAFSRAARRAGDRYGAETRNLEHAARTLDAGLNVDLHHGGGDLLEDVGKAERRALRRRKSHGSGPGRRDQLSDPGGGRRLGAGPGDDPARRRGGGEGQADSGPQNELLAFQHRRPCSLLLAFTESSVRPWI